jgi:ribonuclease HI
MTRAKKRVPKTKKYYAVARGRAPGVYETWSECEQQVKGYRGASFKSFEHEDDAWEYVGSIHVVQKRSERVYLTASPQQAPHVVHVCARSAAYLLGDEQAHGTYQLHVLQGTRVQSGRIPRATSNQAAIYAWAAAFDYMTQYTLRGAPMDAVVFALTHPSQYVLDVFVRDVLHSTPDWEPLAAMKNHQEWRLLHGMYHRFLEACEHVVYIARTGAKDAEYAHSCVEEGELAQQCDIAVEDAQ